jgi:PTH1 family peptidyl-tRNA hydrolase
MLINKPVKTLLLVGLGNPGYSKSRHNLGADFLLFFFKNDEKIFIKSNLFIVKKFNKTFIVYICPSVMNISGEQVKWAFNQFKCDELVVFVDDMDTKLGQYKISHGIGSGGHNGVKSIIKHLPNHKIIRVKLGIGRPLSSSVDKFVLGYFSNDEQLLIHQMFKIAQDTWFLNVSKKCAIT